MYCIQDSLGAMPFPERSNKLALQAQFWTLSHDGYYLGNAAKFEEGPSSSSEGGGRCRR